MPIKLSLKEALARQAEWQGASPEPSASLTPNVWIKPGHIPHTIGLAKEMMNLGLRLWLAHDAISRLAAGEIIALEIPGEVKAIAAALEPYGVIVTAYEQEPAIAPAGLGEPDSNIR